MSPALTEVALTDVALEMEPPLIVAPVIVVPLTSSGSEKATPTGLVFGMEMSSKEKEWAYAHPNYAMR